MGLSDGVFSSWNWDRFGKYSEKVFFFLLFPFRLSLSDVNVVSRTD